MLTLFLWYATFLADPVTIVQLRYPVVRTTITTASGYNVFYSLPSDAPLELRRAYKTLEIAERDVIVIEALQRLRIDIINNERRLEALRAARLAVYLSNHIRGPQLRYFGPLMQAPSPALLRAGVSYGLASEPTVERAALAQERLVAARQQLHQTLYAIAYPERAKLAPQPDPVPIPLPAPMPAPVPPLLLATQRRDRG